MALRLVPQDVSGKIPELQEAALEVRGIDRRGRGVSFSMSSDFSLKVPVLVCIARNDLWHESELWWRRIAVTRGQTLSCPG